MHEVQKRKRACCTEVSEQRGDKILLCQHRKKGLLPLFVFSTCGWRKGGCGCVSLSSSSSPPPPSATHAVPLQLAHGNFRRKNNAMDSAVAPRIFTTDVIPLFDEKHQDLKTQVNNVPAVGSATFVYCTAFGYKLITSASSIYCPPSATV